MVVELVVVVVVVVLVVEMTRKNGESVIYEDGNPTERTEHVLSSIAVASVCRTEECRDTVVRRNTIRPSTCPPAATSIEFSYKEVMSTAEVHSRVVLGSRGLR